MSNDVLTGLCIGGPIAGKVMESLYREFTYAKMPECNYMRTCNPKPIEDSAIEESRYIYRTTATGGIFIHESLTIVEAFELLLNVYKASTQQGEVTT